MIAEMDCRPIRTAKKNKEQIHKAEFVHISSVNNNQNSQLLVEVCAFMFKKNSVYTCVSNKVNHFKSITLKNYACSPIKL